MWSVCVALVSWLRFVVVSVSVMEVVVSDSE